MDALTNPHIVAANPGHFLPTVDHTLAHIREMQMTTAQRTQFAQNARDLLTTIARATSAPTFDDVDDDTALRAAHIHYISVAGLGDTDVAAACARKIESGAADDYERALAAAIERGGREFTETFSNVLTIGCAIERCMRATESTKAQVTPMADVAPAAAAAAAPVRDERSVRVRKADARRDRAREADERKKSMDLAMRMMSNGSFMEKLLDVAKEELGALGGVDEETLKQATNTFRANMAARGGITDADRARVEQIAGPMMGASDPREMISALMGALPAGARKARKPTTVGAKSTRRTAKRTPKVTSARAAALEARAAGE